MFKTVVCLLLILKISSISAQTDYEKWLEQENKKFQEFIEAKDKALRVLCFFHGALAVSTLVGPLMSGMYLSTSGETDFTGYYVLLFWCIVFVPITLLFMRYFKEGQRF